MSQQSLFSNAKRALAPPSPSPSIGSTTSAAAGGTTPRKDRGGGGNTPRIVYSQPESVTKGESMMTQLSYAIKWLRDKDEAQTLDAIARYLSLAAHNSELLAAFANQMRTSSSVEWIPDPDLTEQTWQTGMYRHRAAIPGVRSKQSLLAYLQKRTDAAGVSVKDLKDGWPDCDKALKELEAEHRLLVVRQKKDGAPRVVWPDDPSLFHPVDPEFRTLWHRVELPAADNIVQRLAAVGQKPASEDPRAKLLNQPKVDKKKKRQVRRSTKLTNSHMGDKFRDFSHMKR